MAENKYFNKQNTKPKKHIISTKHKLKSEKHTEKRRSCVLKKAPTKDVKQMQTNTCPDQSFYPTPSNLSKCRSYIKKGIYPVDCSICQGSI